MNHKEFNEWIKTRSKSIQDLNRSVHSRVSSKPKPMDREEVREAQRNEKMGEEYQLCNIDVVFFAQHGKRMDHDNGRYVVKPIQDAATNLGLAQDDSHITSETTQRFDEAEVYL